jgi:subtilase family serine protease
VQLKQTATLTVTVTNDSSTTAPTGSVQLTDNGTNLGSAQTLNPGPGNSSTATFTVRGLALGTHNIVATYGGVQPTFGQSFGSVAMQFSPKPH